MKTAAMTPAARTALNRRNFLKSAGVLIVGFRMAGDAAQAQFGQAPLPGAPPMDQVDSWIAIADDGSITGYSGKEELGQGISTAQQQLVAEELSVPFDRVKLIYCDTALTPDQAYTSGSQSHPANFNHGNLAQAGATAREAAGRARGTAHRRQRCDRREGRRLEEGDLRATGRRQETQRETG
jgi:CO/xanthine dehydrogenase Mo-binding subunit